MAGMRTIPVDARSSAVVPCAHSMSTLTRRAFLVFAALLAPVARLRAIAQQTRTSPPEPPAISVQEFVRLSRRLLERTNLDSQVAGTYLTALLAVPDNTPLLADLARSTTPGPDRRPAHLALERAIVESWYTGIYTVNGERRLATHTGALMWTALGMPAPGTCTNGFGAWSRAPQATA